MPKVSVVIPCFNLGNYIHEAINSVLNQTFQDFEIIIVDDGSTDAQTKRILNDLNLSKVKVLTTLNQGLSLARNTGIAQASGKYILPLDADDKIADSYLEKAVAILDKDENTGIVYCEASFFGEVNSIWILPDYKLSRILLDNQIFCTAFFRRSDWEQVDGYKSSMIYGWEDYDFWLSIIELKKEVYKIPECLFFYRKRFDSMTDKLSKENYLYSYKEIVRNHQKLYVDNIEHVFEHIYNLRDTVAEEQRENSDRISQINILNSQISILNSQMSSLRSIIKLLFKRITKIFI